MYCRNCGNEVKDNAYYCKNCETFVLEGKKYCPDCGSSTNHEDIRCLNCSSLLSTKKNQPRNNMKDYYYDEPDVLANVVSFFCFNPIIGIILYFVWMDSKPRAAKSVCLWTILGFISPIFIYLFFLILGALFEMR